MFPWSSSVFAPWAEQPGLCGPGSLLFTFCVKGTSMKPNGFAMVSLKNGSQEPLSVVADVILTLLMLRDNDLQAFHELVQSCFHPHNRPIGPPAERLREQGLLKGGAPVACVKNVLLSVIDPNDRTRNVGNPIKKAERE